MKGLKITSTPDDHFSAGPHCRVAGRGHREDQKWRSMYLSASRCYCGQRIATFGREIALAHLVFGSSEPGLQWLFWPCNCSSFKWSVCFCQGLPSHSSACRFPAMDLIFLQVNYCSRFGVFGLR